LLPREINGRIKIGVKRHKGTHDGKHDDNRDSQTSESSSRFFGLIVEVGVGTADHTPLIRSPAIASTSAFTARAAALLAARRQLVRLVFVWFRVLDRFRPSHIGSPNQQKIEFATHKSKAIRWQITQTTC
jgi:hypothetical protein